MLSKKIPVSPSNISRRLLNRRYVFIFVVLTALFIGCGRAGDPATEETAATEATTATPTPLPTVTATRIIEEESSQEEPPPDFVEIAENSEASTRDTLGQINVEYSVRLSPNSGDGSVIVSVRIPEMLVSIDPVEIEKVTIPEDALPIVGKQESYEAVIRIARQMRIEMDAPTLLNISGPTELIQDVDVELIDEPTFWLWTFKAPEDIGYHNFTLSVYINDELNPTWVRVFQIEVRDPTTPTATFTLVPTLTPTPTPTATFTPTPVPFMATPTGTASIIGGIIILVILIVGLLIVGLRKGNAPIIGNINRRRSLQKQIVIHTQRLQLLQERQAQQGINTDPATIIEIETIEKELEKLKAELGTLDPDDVR